MKKIVSLLVLLTIFVASLAACAPQQAPTAAPEAAATEVPAAAKEPEVAVVNSDVVTADSKLDEDITLVQALDMVSWDPINTSDLSNAYVLFSVYSRLFNVDESLKGTPELCKEFKQVSDTEWHFTIYEGVKTHDGGDLTADDVVWSLNRTKTGSAIGALFTPVKEITKVDDYTISITTNGPYPALPSALSHQATSIVPQSWGEKALAADDWTHPIGSGRYKFVSRNIGDNVVLERFDGYFNQEEKARNKTLTYKIMPEGSSRTIAVETGEADIAVDFNTVDYDRVMKNPNVKLWQHYSQTVWHLGMDTTAEWLDNKIVRQAISYAIDHEAALEVGHNGKGQVFYNSATFAPTTLGAVNNPLGMYKYDPEKAKALMKEAGAEAGFNTQIIVFRDEAERIATLIQAYLKEININAEVVRIENAVFSSYIADHKAPMFITSWGCYWDADLFVPRRFGKAGIGGVNRGWYLNPELDEMVLEARSTFDEAKRVEVYKRIQDFMAVEAVEVDLYVNTMFALTAKDLKGVEINVERPWNYWKLHY